MLRRSGPLIALVSALILLGAACGADDNGDGSGVDQTGDGMETTPTEPATEPADGEATATIGMIDFAFVPEETLLPSGSTVLLENTGQVPHTFTIADEGMIDEEVAEGGTGEVTIDLEPGTYDFICRFHESQGMVGTLTIE